MINLAQQTAVACMAVFGEPVIYNGSEQRGIASTEVVEVDGYDQAVEHRMAISILVADYPTITPGALVELRGKSYRVDRQMDTQDDPTVMVKLVLR